MIACILLPDSIETLVPPPKRSPYMAKAGFNPPGYNLDELLALLADFSSKVEAGTTSKAAAIYLELDEFPPPVLLEQAELIKAALHKQVGFAAAVGIAAGKFPAYIAATAINPGRTVILTPGSEAGFLARLTIDYLPLDQELARRFRLLGLTTMGQLVDLPAGAVLSQFGFQGRRLQQLAQGQDDRPILPAPYPQVEAVTRLFDEPVVDRLVLQQQLEDLIAVLAQRLSHKGQVAQILKVNLRLENSFNWQQQIVLRRATGDAVKLHYVCLDLLNQAHLEAGVMAVSLQVAGLVPAVGQQLELFDGSIQQRQQLHRLLADLVARYGWGRFFYVALTHTTSLLPEQRFRLDEVNE